MKKTGPSPKPVFESEFDFSVITRQNQNSFFRSVLNAMISGVVISDVKGKLFFNQSAEQILGMKVLDVPPEEWSEAYGLFLPDRVTLFPVESLPLSRALKGEFVRDVEIFVRNECHPAGLWLLVNASPVWDENGKPDGGVVIFRDMTSLKESKKNLKEVEHRLEAILDNTPAVVYVKDLEGRYLFTNSTYENLIQKPRTEILSKTDYELWPSEMADAFRANDLLVQQAKEPIQFEEIALRKGELRTYVSVKFPLRDIYGEIYGVCGISTDITERKQAEEALKQTRVFLDSIVDNLPDMVFVKDAKDLRFIKFNKAGEDLIGYSRESLIGKSDYDFFPKDEADFFTAKDRETLASGKLLNVPEEMIDTRYKGRRILRTKKIPINDSKGNPLYLLGISEDITENKLVKEALIRKTVELAGSVAERQQLELFAYVASHDLQEPLQKIIAFSDMLASHSASVLDEKGMEFLKRTQNAAFRMSRLVEDLVRFSRALTRTTSKTEFSLEGILEEVKYDLERLIQEAGAEIHSEPLPRIHADKIQLRQLLYNLLSNAVKFRKKDEKPVITVTSKLLDGGQKLELTVADNGIGFDPKFKEHIFKPFERLHSKSVYDGSGLGLSICSRIAIAHGGDIRAEGEPGKGSRFIVTLSIKKEEPKTDTNPALPGIFT